MTIETATTVVVAPKVSVNVPEQSILDATYFDGVKVDKARKLTVKRIKLSDIDPKIDENNRNMVGHEFFGQTVTKDTYDVDTMVEQIIDAGDILTPIEGGYLPGESKFAVGRGRRRVLAALKIVATRAGTPIAELFVTKGIPCMIHDGITAAELALLNNDQQSKPYLKSEVYRDFTRQVIAGAPLRRLATQQMQALTGAGFGRLRSNEYDALSVEEKAKKLTSWLNSTIDQTIGYSCLSGPRVYNLYGQALAHVDGIVAVKPEVDLLGTMPNGKKSRVYACWTAVKEDTAAGEHNYSSGSGPRLEALFELLKAHDSGETKTDKDTADKLKPGADIRSLVDMHRSNDRTLVSRILSMVFASNQGDPVVIDKVHMFDDANRTYQQYREHLNFDTRMLLDLIFVSGNVQKFDALLSLNVLPSITPIPDTETDDTETDDVETKDLSNGYSPVLK